MAVKNILVCDGCGREIKSNAEHYHIDFASSRFCDAAGDMDYNTVRVDFCEKCCKNITVSLKKIVEKQ